MKRSRLWLIPVCSLLLVGSAAAQKSKRSAPDAQNNEKVKDMVNFLQYVLNTLGSSQTPARDKDILITESYAKIFRDADVQIEDDLDEERHVITNKDVQAYLKDVDFFFKDVHFEFTIDDIQYNTMPNGKVFYKVSIRRNLQGATIDGKTINNTRPRYLEINYTPEDQDLKIVSIYTNEFDEKEALTNWWMELSYEWQAIFKRKLNIIDSVQFSDIQNIISIEELDLSNNRYIQTIEPLAQLNDLKLLNLSGTATDDLTPIRNLTELVELNLSHTTITDLTPLRYSTGLIRLDISHTPVADISVMEKMPLLQNLEMSGTKTTDFFPLVHLTQLVHLNLDETTFSDASLLAGLTNMMDLSLSRTLVMDLSALKELKKLLILTVDSTGVQDLAPTHHFENLRILNANYTGITNLDPLQNLPHLERVYCDVTGITKEKAQGFMTAKPNVLVIFDSKDLMTWWEGLMPAWQEIFRTSAGVGSTPSKTELAKITNLDSINIAGRSLADIEPLHRLQKLRVLVAGNTALKSLSPLREHRDIHYLDISETAVNDLSVLESLAKLQVLKADRTKIESLEPLFNSTALEKLYVDQTAIHDITAAEFLEWNPGCLIVYKTNRLNRWWNDLPAVWKDVFRIPLKKDGVPSRENLHNLIETEVLQFSNISVTDLSPLNEFVRLKELHFSHTSVASIPSLENLRSLTSLHASNSPLADIEAIAQFSKLEHLDISNTAVDNLKSISNLQQLTHLNCSGTPLKKLDPLEKLPSLELLDCSNTGIKKLSPINHLPLKTLKCYNTNVSKREVERFKKNSPGCEVVFY